MSQPYSLGCPNCGQTFEVALNMVVLPGSPEMEALRAGELNQATCPSCGQKGVLPVPFVLYQPAEQRAVCFIVQYANLEQEKQQSLVQALIQVLQQTPGYEAKELKEVGVVEDYATMRELARGEEIPQQSAEEARVEGELGLLREFLNSGPAKRAALFEQNREKLPELAELAHAVANRLEEEKQDPVLVAGVRILARQMQEAAQENAPDQPPPEN